MFHKYGMRSLLLGVLICVAAGQGACAKSTSVTPTTTKTIAGKTVTVYQINSDGIPYYGTNNAAGFPNATYTHTAASVSYIYYLPASPTLTGTAAAPVYTPVGLSDDFGVGYDGIPFDPLTSDCKGTASTVANCTFRLEGRLQVTPWVNTNAYTTGRLGFDVHNGHVQSSGAYHYHGIPCGISTGGTTLITCNPTSTSSPWASLPSSPVVVGYARDGYPIVVAANVYASYTVVSSSNASASRPTTNPADSTNAYGNWSADMVTLVTSGSTFTQANLPSTKLLGDFVYTGPSTLGTSTAALGLCNEAPNTSATIQSLDGKTAAYVYYLTPNFPMVPRCLIGVTDGPTDSTQGFYHAGSLD